MSVTPPQEAAEFRGNSHTPVSPKPSYFPSPANIPILEAQMDPTFHETMMQTMHPNTFSAAQSTTQFENATTSDGVAAQSALSATDAPGTGGAQADEAADGHRQIQESEQYNPQNDTSHVIDQNVSQGTSSLPQDLAASSEAVQATPVAETSPGVDHASLDPSTAPAAASIYPDANTHTDPNQPPNPQQALTAAGLDLDAILAGLEKQVNAPKSPPPVNSAATTNSTPPRNSKPEPSSLPPNPNLPPKPPAQEKPTSHPNYTPSDDIRSYHPHSQNETSAPYRAAGLPNINTNGLPQPPHAYQTPLSSTFVSSTQSPAASNYGQRDGTPTTEDEDVPLDPQTQRLYDQFLSFERQNVADGQWDKFPVGSRLFIGNLPTEKVTKKDIYRRFYKYGQLAQISLKQAYGFVQFLDSETCHRALSTEQGQKMRGRDMHLEISKPQKNTRSRDNAGDNRGARRRSRSPDYNRGGNQAPRGVDRYTSGSQTLPRDRDFRRGGRDEYRRSPSPRGRRNNIDRYDGRRRSRSRSPYGRDVQQRSAPRGLEDDLPLPKRAPQDVPDVQIIVADDLDRQFIEWADKSIQARGLRVNVLLLAPHLSEEAVIKRQILEGVQAVVRLSRIHQLKGKIPLQVFDRRGGHHNVQFEQYEDLDPNIAAELVLRAKQTHGAPAQQVSYGLPPQAPPTNYGLPPPGYGYTPPNQPPPQHLPPNPYLNPYGPPAPASSAPPPVMTQTQHYQLPGQAQPGPDLARILGQLGQSGPPPARPQQPPYAPPQQYAPPPLQQYSAPPSQQYALPQAPPSQSQAPYASPQQPPAAPQDIQALLANLSAYKPPS